MIYNIVSARYTDDLVKKVNEYLEEGWVLKDNLIAFQGESTLIFVQAMVKYSKTVGEKHIDDMLEQVAKDTKGSIEQVEECMNMKLWELEDEIRSYIETE